MTIKDSIASAFEFSNRDEVVANVVSKEQAYIDFVEITFKDQFISRSDMWRLRSHMKDTFVYMSKNITFACMRAQISEILASGHTVFSGLINEKTKFVFRSKSAEILLMINMSREMWEYSDYGELHFEKAVNRLLPLLFSKWHKIGATHSLTIILFSRTIYSEDVYLSMDPQDKEIIMKDTEGNYYHDFYNVICVEERLNWDKFILNIKERFAQYPSLVNWNRKDINFSRNGIKYLGENTRAEKSCFLEAISLAQTMLDARQLKDRDLTRLGQSIVVVSAGTGLFYIDPVLESLTKQRMIDKGIACDLVCLTKPPLHVVPLFCIKTKENSIPLNTNHSQPIYKLAHWVYTFFFDTHVLLEQNLDEYRSFKRFTSSCILSNQEGDLLCVKENQPFVPYKPKQNEFLLKTESDEPNIGVPDHTEYLTNEQMEKHDTELFHLNLLALEDGVVVNSMAEVVKIGSPYRSKEDTMLEHHKGEKPRSRTYSNASSHYLSPSTPKNPEKGHTPPGLSRSRLSMLSTSHIPSPNYLVSSPRKGSVRRLPEKVLNPFNCEILPPPPSSNRRRWVHLWSQSSAQYDYLDWDLHGPHWKSITYPALLPLTTDYFPSPIELKTFYQEYPSTLSLHPDENLFQDQTDQLLKELIAQRLAQGCQLVRLDNVVEGEKESSFCMSAGYTFHKLSYEPSTQNIDVKIYLSKKKLMQSQSGYSYKYFVRTHNTGRVIPKSVEMSYEAMAYYKWNNVDHLVCGYCSEFQSSMRYWTTSLCLVTSEKNFDRTSVVEGFLKLKDFFVQRATKTSDESLSQMDIEIAQLPQKSKTHLEELNKVSEDEETSSHEALPSSPIERKSIRVDMDKSKTNRYEWIQIKYDTLFDPNHSYHLDFQWIVATGCVVNDFISQCARKAKSFGLTLFFIPKDYRTEQLFYSPSKGTIDFKNTNLEVTAAIETTLLDYLDFVPMKSKNHYIHRTGYVIIIFDDMIFEWIVNWTIPCTLINSEMSDFYTKFIKYCAVFETLRNNVYTKSQGNPDNNILDYILTQVNYEK